MKWEPAVPYTKIQINLITGYADFISDKLPFLAGSIHIMQHKKRAEKLLFSNLYFECIKDLYSIQKVVNRYFHIRLPNQICWLLYNKQSKLHVDSNVDLKDWYR